jgi:hypothetical protein
MGNIFEDQAMAESVFRKTILTHTLFEEVDLDGAVFRNANLGQASFDDVNLGQATIRNANLTNVRIEDANIGGLTIDGFRVDSLIEAERDRLDPERVRLRMTDLYDLDCVHQVMHRLDEVRAAFTAFLRLQEAGILIAQPEPGEWSALECLRHMLFAEDLYLNRWLLRNDIPWLEQGKLSAFLVNRPGFERVEGRPDASLEEILAAWEALHCQTWQFIDQLTPNDLRRSTRDVDFGQGDVAHVLQGIAHHDLVHIRQAEAAVALVMGE